MSASGVADSPVFAFDNTFARELEGFYVPAQPATSPSPTLLALNAGLAIELGLDPAALASPNGVAVLAGNAIPLAAAPLAQAYAGHQFGSFNPQLGDGRALLLGEVIDVHGRRRDIQFKGSGRTPFSRRGDGKAAVGPMLREYLLGEAMHALGIPTTRALAVVATGEHIQREAPLPGAVLTRVAASHLRIGTFEFFSARGAPEQLRRLAHYAITRHHPQAAEAPNPYVALIEAVVDTQASLVAQWMLVGFVHGVMNTDNMTISGETIDFGPCAFIDQYDPASVFSSIDHGGRYAYGNQPLIARWNLARFAESLLPLIDESTDRAVALATAAVERFQDLYDGYWLDGMRQKLGLTGAEDSDRELVGDVLALLRDHHVDYTMFFRRLASGTAGELFPRPEALEHWTRRWLSRLAGADPAPLMQAVNPCYIPRNHLVEAALDRATEGDLTPFAALAELLAHPFDQRPGHEEYEVPAPASFGRYRTY